MLYIIATPIGNLGDLTYRAVEILRSVSVIAAEDTRNSRVLLDRYEIAPEKLIAYHKFNEENSADGIIALLKDGKDVALITDAGTPCISDPGYILVKKVTEAGLDITTLPGACAAISALTLSGFNTISFSFYGFLPRERGDILRVLTRIRSEYSPVAVFYESPQRIHRTIGIIAEALPACRVCLANDLTKKFERIYRGTPEEVLQELEANENAHRGEYVLVLELSPEADNGEELPSAEAVLVDYMVKHSCDAKQAVTELAADVNVRFAKNELKKAALSLKERLGDHR